MKDFNQFYISPTLNYFKQGFQERWDLEYYNNLNTPAIFFGLYQQEDIQAFLNHKGPRIIVWGGNDMQHQTLQYIANLQSHQEIYTWAYPGSFSDILSFYNIKHKQLYVTLKDYSSFNPTTLGENIYVYKGIHGNRPDYYEWDKIVNPLIEVFGKDRIMYSNHLSINELVENVYKKCFVYVKPNPKGGCTTMFELGHMGIKTIGKKHENLDFFSEYNDIYHLIELIAEESKYIGEIRKDVAESTKNIFVGEEWLNLNWWNE